ncbi:uncharacterized protein LOC108956550 isoform X1 [Eucalyptus grandis]|uniref:uncharacterized protein LOC108956550 isoform X1 n=1 Tax=Eucalyptus grandis TaxID=71139 RepID=UPI00192EB357|nr:uncharacterized protein LOC108956550 isoform X1 [Eucalyptus grandis]
MMNEPEKKLSPTYGPIRPGSARILSLLFLIVSLPPVLPLPQSSLQNSQAPVHFVTLSLFSSNRLSSRVFGLYPPPLALPLSSHLPPDALAAPGSFSAMETDEGSRHVLPFQLQFDKPLASQVKMAEWNPEKDLLAMVTEDSKVVLHRFNWQRLWTISPSGFIQGSLSFDGCMLRRTC